MFPQSKKKYQLGVINLTPNSFSDGGEISSSSELLKKLKSSTAIDFFDFGAESTAPMNQAINEDQEWSRFKPFLDLLKTLNHPLSFDTYHVETIERLSYEFKDFSYPIIWNDVSGKWSSEVDRFLAQSVRHFYVYSHNLAPSRDLTGSHMKFLSSKNGDDFIQEMSDFFLSKKHDRVFFDPCFGFSKSYEQNWSLFDSFAKLLDLVEHNNWMIGISRKSFLRKKLGLDALTADAKLSLDRVHDDFINRLIQRRRETFIIRKHF